MVTYAPRGRLRSITGVGVVSTFGDSADGFRDAPPRGPTGSSLSDVRGGAMPVHACRALAGFDPAHWIPPMKLRRMDATGPLAMACRQAMEQAQYAVGEGDDVPVSCWAPALQADSDHRLPVRVLLGWAVGRARAALQQHRRQRRDRPRRSRVQAARAERHHQPQGGVRPGGHCDRGRPARHPVPTRLSPGVSSRSTISSIAHDRFSVMNAAPAFDESAAPFSWRAAGFVLGEGAFGLWLERGENWRARGHPAWPRLSA